MREEKSGYSLNLANKPFVNMALPITLAVAFALAVVAFTIINTWVILSETIHGSDSEVLIAEAKERIENLKKEIDSKDIKLSAFNIPRVSKEVINANEIIRQRSMSWTRLFDRLETVSPSELRMLRISPNARKDNIDLNLRVEVPRQEVLTDFIDALKKSEFFSRINIKSESSTNTGTQVWELSLNYYDAR